MAAENQIEREKKKGKPIPVRKNVKRSIRLYLKDMAGSEPEGLHQILLAQVEPPLIQEVLRYTQGNQTRAARVLGITRNTLRSKMERYGIEPPNGKNRRK